MAEKTARALGKFFEGAAKKYLEARGMQCVDRNYVCRGGELDLVLRDGAYWVFAEVKARKSADYGTPAEFVNATKRRRLWRAAQSYMLENGIGEDAFCRFDIVEITYRTNASGVPQDLQINHIADAFWQER